MQSYFICICFSFWIIAEVRLLKLSLLCFWKVWLSKANPPHRRVYILPRCISWSRKSRRWNWETRILPFIKRQKISPLTRKWNKFSKSFFCHYNYQINSGSDERPGHQSLINVTLCGLRRSCAWLKNKPNDISIRVCFINNASRFLKNTSQRVSQRHILQLALTASHGSA